MLYCTVLYCTVLVTILQVPGWAESFLRRDPAPAAAWLAATLPTELASFTNNFGHRCLKVMIMHYTMLNGRLKMVIPSKIGTLVNRVYQCLPD